MMRLFPTITNKKLAPEVEVTITNSISTPPPCSNCSEIPSDNVVIANEKYPILCPTKGCEFNFCSPCLTTMLSNFYVDGRGLSLRELNIPSDDGENGQTNHEFVACQLNCPKCGKPFCVSVEDVLMLRRAVVWRRALKDTCDEELNASELREKYYWNETRLSGLKLAETRYANESMKE